MANKVVIGVMGSGDDASQKDIDIAFDLGKRIATEGWILLSGGRNVGVMDAANKGAKSAGGLTIGILPGKDREQLSEYVDAPIVTGMGGARNYINVLSSDVVIACGVGGAGTASEIALSLKHKRPTILLAAGAEAESFFKTIGGDLLHIVDTPEKAITLSKTLIS